MTDLSASVALIVVNWNNSRDTLLFLKSFNKQETNFKVTCFVADNGSDDDSVLAISEYLSGCDPNFKTILLENKTGYYSIPEKLEYQHFYLCLNGENFGFAKGNNLIIKLALEMNYDWILLLNNDTVLPEGQLHSLLAYTQKINQIKIWTPVITYYEPDYLIWNAGGYLNRLGNKKYIGYKKHRSLYPSEGHQPITFVTGCALLVHNTIWKKYGLLTEKFFFGEEDYYFSKLMERNKEIMAVCWESEIRHKVSVSINNLAGRSILAMAVNHDLNRIIDMKYWMSKPLFYFWKPLYLLESCLRLLISGNLPISSCISFYLTVFALSSELKKVSKEDFLKIRAGFIT